MKYLIFILSFFAADLKAQKNLSFDHRFVESENKWVAFKTSNDSLFNYGFIYIDASAGLTFNLEGSFTVSKNGKFIPKKLDNVGMKYRLEPNTVKVAIIPATKYTELEIKEYPDWLKTYLGDTTSVEHLYRWGFLYNGYNECAKALTYLERAQKMDTEFKGLEVELAFSYNCLNQYDKAILVLQSALEKNRTDAYTYKELIYAQIKSGQLDKALESCKKAIAVCTDKTYNGENCYNLLHTYYEKKDKKNFNLWLPETKKWNADNVSLTNSIKQMEENLSK